ncbi:MAG: glycosyltransferase family 2 protein [Steroidobacter sp.]
MSSQKKMPLVSVITICRNAEDEISGTIASVLNQSYPTVEYIVIDGASTDGTVEKIKAAQNRISTWVSEKDAGIYDAMNKGARLATGEWIIFMNAGDRFYSNDAVKDLLCAHKADADLLYGDHEVRYPGGSSRIERAAPPSRLWKGMICSHQALLSKTTLLRQNPFDTSERVTADFAFLLQQQVNGKRIEHCDVVVASILAGGVSDTRRVNAIRGYYRTVSRTHKGLRVKAYYFAALTWNLCKALMMAVMPPRAWERLAMLKHRLVHSLGLRRARSDADSAP